MLSLNCMEEGQNVPPQNMPLWHIFLSCRQVRNSRCRKGYFYLKAKAGHKFLGRKVLSLYQKEENILLTGEGVHTKMNLCKQTLLK